MTTPPAEALVDVLVRVARLEALDVDSVARALGGRPGQVQPVPGNSYWKMCVLELAQGLFVQAEVSWNPEHSETLCYAKCIRPRAAVPRAAVRELLALAARPRSIRLSWFKDQPHEASDVLLAPRDALHLRWTADEPRRRWLLSELSVPRAWPAPSLVEAPAHAVRVGRDSEAVELRIAEGGPFIDMATTFPHGARAEMLRHQGDTMRDMFESTAAQMWDAASGEDGLP